MGIGANSGGGLGVCMAVSFVFAYVLRTCSEEVIEFPLFMFLKFRPHKVVECVIAALVVLRIYAHSDIAPFNSKIICDPLSENPAHPAFLRYDRKSVYRCVIM